jgi:diguanylate cyclase (GGDEF)-like protein/PAS domain S-box-containing protein
VTPPAPTILIVDDEPLNRELLQALLKPEGYLTQSAGSGQEALEAVARLPPDLILLDIMMPGMDGYQVATMLKANPVTAHIPIIMVTALDDRDARLTGLKAGAEEFVTKPVERAELWLRVRNLLRLKTLSDFLQNHSSILEREVRERTAELQRFRSAMDATADAILMMDRGSMQFTEVNATACTMLGYSRDELFELGPCGLWEIGMEPLQEIFDSIIARVGSNQSIETRVRRKDGSMLEVEQQRHAHLSGTHWTIVGLLHDITERKLTQQRLEYLAYYDVLTGLANRGLFLERVAQHMLACVRSAGKLAVFVIDLERFKNINDSFGQDAGDALLTQVAQWLTRYVANASLVARVGADQFAFVLPEVRTGDNVGHLLERKIDAFLVHPFQVNGAVFRVAAKIGAALFPDDGDSAETVFRNAEAALNKAKTRGARYLFYKRKMTARVAGNVTLENQLRQAVEQGEFVLHYQPKVNLVSGKMVSAEALLRWNDPQTGLVSPGRFIPILEETGLINEVGRWALRKAVEDYLHWRSAGLPAVRIAVNVSPLQLRNDGFIDEIEQVLAIGEHAEEGLELEITESVIMEDVRHNIVNLQKIRAMGVRIAIDDFGTGFSSLSYLAKLPVHSLKIDRSFVVDMTLSPQGLALVSTIIDLAHALNLKVIAEGVETEEQSRLLRLLTCDEMQGYLFSKPVARDEFESRFLGK